MSSIYTWAITYVDGDDWSGPRWRATVSVQAGTIDESRQIAEQLVLALRTSTLHVQIVGSDLLAVT